MFQQGRAISTIEGYRAALGSTFNHTGGPELANNYIVCNLIKSFKVQKPKEVRSLPNWDLNFVLIALTREPYEPIKLCAIMQLTLKTFFLILLASGRRRSEILAIDIRRTECAQDGSLFLYPNLAFVPKTQAATEQGGTAFSPIKLTSLSGQLSKTDPDGFYCPVRAYHAYIKRTKPFRNNRHALFLPTQPGRANSLKVNTLTGWTKKLITDIYREADQEVKQLYSIGPHQVRSLATSLASAGGASMQHVMKAGTWTNHSTFTHHYLQDVTILRGQLKALSPLVVAQYQM